MSLPLLLGSLCLFLSLSTFPSLFPSHFLSSVQSNPTRQLFGVSFPLFPPRELFDS